MTDDVMERALSLGVCAAARKRPRDTVPPCPLSVRAAGKSSVLVRPCGL